MVRPYDRDFDEDLLRIVVDGEYKGSFLAFVLPKEDQYQTLCSDRALILKALSQPDCVYRERDYFSALVLNRVNRDILSDPEFQLEPLRSHWDKLCVIFREHTFLITNTYTVNPEEFEVFTNPAHRNQVVDILSHYPASQLPDYLNGPMQSILKAAKKRYQEQQPEREKKQKERQDKQREDIKNFHSRVMAKYNGDRFNACLDALGSSEKHLHSTALVIMEEIFEEHYEKKRLWAEI